MCNTFIDRHTKMCEKMQLLKNVTLLQKYDDILIFKKILLYSLYIISI